MKESEKWLALCDLHCQFRRHFPNCVCCDIAMEYRRCKSEEKAEKGEKIQSEFLQNWHEEGETC